MVRLASRALPFRVNVGDADFGYVFLSLDGEQGRFLWRCA